MSVIGQLGYLVVIFLAILVNLYLLHLIERQRNQQVVRYLVYIIILSTLSLIAILGLSLAPNHEFAFFWTRVRVLSLNAVPFIFTLWILQYAEQHHWVKFPRSLLLSTIWLIMAFFGIFDPHNPIFTQDWLLYRYELIQVEAFRLGSIRIIASIYYAGIFVAGIWIFFYRYWRIASLINVQTAWILGGFISASILANSIMWGFLPEGTPNAYPFGALFAGLMIMRGLKLSPLIDVAPVAHELVFQNIAEPVLVLSEKNVILDFNPAAERLFPLNMPSRGQALSSHPHMVKLIENISENQEVTLNSCTYTISTSPLKSGQQRYIGRALIFTDITERKKNDAERENLILTLDAYARTVAHDLKTPVAIIKGYLELAQMGIEQNIPTHKLTSYLAQAEKGTDNLSDIISSLLLLATLRRIDKLTMVYAPMNNILDTVQGRLDLIIRNSGAQISIDPQLPDAIGVIAWIEEIFLNYISNAIKYGGKPPIIVISSCPDTRPELVRYTVQDNGSGLTKDEQKRLFKEFSRLERHQDKEGHGLGLVIVRQMVERMGGTAAVENAANGGSIFSFSLPRA